MIRPEQPPSLSPSQREEFIEILALTSPASFLAFASEKMGELDFDWIGALVQSRHMINNNVMGTWPSKPTFLHHNEIPRVAAIARTLESLAMAIAAGKPKEMAANLERLQPFLTKWVNRFTEAIAKGEFNSVKPAELGVTAGTLFCLTAFVGRVDLMECIDRGVAPQQQAWDVHYHAKFMAPLHENIMAMTPLGFAAAGGRPECVEWLLRKGSDPRIAAKRHPTKEEIDLGVTDYLPMMLVAAQFARSDDAMARMWHLQNTHFGVTFDDTQLAVSSVKTLLSSNRAPLRGIAPATTAFLIDSGLVHHDIAGIVDHALATCQHAFLAQLQQQIPDALQQVHQYGSRRSAFASRLDTLTGHILGHAPRDVCEEAMAKTIRLVVEAGCPVDAPIYDRENELHGTALHWAIQIEKKKVVQTLLELGADPMLVSISDKGKYNAIELAQRSRDADLPGILRSHQALDAVKSVEEGKHHVSPL